MITRRGANACKTGNVLAERMTRYKTLQVIPSAHVVAGCGQACALAIDLQQAVIREGEIVRMDCVVVSREGAIGNLHRGIGQSAERFTCAVPLAFAWRRACECGRTECGVPDKFAPGYWHRRAPRKFAIR